MGNIFLYILCFILRPLNGNKIRGEAKSGFAPIRIIMSWEGFARDSALTESIHMSPKNADAQKVSEER